MNFFNFSPSTFKSLFLLFFIFELGCSAKILRPELMKDISKEPQLVDYHDRWFLGYIRKTYTDPIISCVNSTPVKVEENLTMEDIFFGILTIGIYLPITTKVWCVDESTTVSK